MRRTRRHTRTRRPVFAPRPKRSPKRIKRVIPNRAVLVALLLCGLLFYLDHTMSAVVDRSIINHKTNLGTSLLNEAIETALQQTQAAPDPGDFITITYKQDQTVATIQTNTAHINHLNTVLTKQLLSTLRSMETQTLSLPLGSLTDSPLLQGRGPRVQFKFQPGGTMNTSIHSAFSSAGINQTNHQIYLDVAVEMACVGLLRQRKTTVTTRYLVAETIIVGEIPSSYSNILLEDQSRIGKDLSAPSE